MKYNFEQFWCGTELSFQHLMAVLKARMERAPTAPAALYGEDKQSEPKLPWPLTVSGNVGIVTIAGPLTNTESVWNRYDGVISYGEIRAALVHAAQDPNIGAIVLDINSGGGAVSGVSDTAELIKKVDSIKPVHTFSDGMLASAAYWLGSSARSVSIGKVTEAGSIGVLTVHKEISKMLSEIGINATVLRAGEFKALGNQFEPLSDKAKEVIQGQLDSMYQMFVQHVADARGVTYPVADQKMAQGRVFMGDQAVAIGLVDKVSTFDEVVAKAQGAIDSKKTSAQYGANSNKGPAMKVALTEQQIAAAAELGAPVVTATAAAPAAPAAETAPAAPTATTAPVEAAPAPAAPAPAAEQTESQLVAFLKGSLSEAQASVTALTIEVRDLKAQTEALNKSHGPMRELVEASIDRLKIALGGSAGDYKAMSDEAVLAEHANLRAQFEAKFKAGGVAAVAATHKPDQTEVVDPIRAARLASTRPAK